MFVTYTVTVDANGSAADPSGTVSVSDANGACPTNPVSLSMKRGRVSRLV